ncbi:MAG: flagellar biosynthetic protein FliR [Rhodobacteraceae bacterium]|nr:flagellar biosynthetic protein FliR [Paracoccaceae bacterium]
MTAALADLVGIGQAGLAAWFAVFLRVGAVMAVLPAFGEQAVPARVRLALALAFTCVVAPAAPALPLDGPAAAVGRALAAEVLSGLLLGLGLRLFVLALQTAGAIAAQATSLAQIFGGSAGVDPQPAIAHALTIGGLALAVLADLHVRAAEAMIASYDALPPGMLPHAGLVATWGTFRVADAFARGFSLAAPFVAASLVYNVALGVINRAMPQLMVAFVGAPALTLGGLALFAFAAPALLEVWRAALGTYLADPLGAGP